MTSQIDPQVRNIILDILVSALHHVLDYVRYRIAMGIILDQDKYYNEAGHL
jgi:hypothetical protein